MECICGWQAGTFCRRADGERAYGAHLLSALPRCLRCGEPVPPYRVSKLRSSLCRSCSYRSAREWKLQHPKQWERHARRSHLKRHYGLTPEAFDRIFDEQGRTCAICGAEEAKDERGFRPHVDHCHATGRVRGILCGRCNKGLGLFHDDAGLIKRAISYLEGAAR